MNLTFCDLFLALLSFLPVMTSRLEIPVIVGLDVMRVTFSFQKQLKNDFVHHGIAVPLMAAVHSMASGRAFKKRL